MLSVAIKVGRSRRRNTSITSTTITTEISSVTSTSCSADLVVWVRSNVGVMVTLDGSEARNCGSLARIASTVATAFASGRRVICRPTVRSLLNQAPWY